VSTAVTCYDNGTFTLTFQADDGVNPPVSANETLTVLNVPPTPTLTLSPGPYPLGSTVTANVSITDPGTLDTEMCSIDWGDGTSDVVPAPGRTCTDSHAYTSAGAYTVTATAVDKDGGSGTDSKSLVVDGPPVVHVSDASGNEGAAIPLSATANDPENDPLTYSWTATPETGVAPGAVCTFDDPSALTPSVTCNDNGVWMITLTVSDGVNPPVTSSAGLTVLNVAPKPTLMVPLGAQAQGSTVTASASIADPGSIDTFGCTFEWADGTPTTTVLAVGTICSASHVYAHYGHYPVTVTVVDKDGGTGTDTGTIFVDGPPTVSVANASGNEGALIPLTASATDPEGDPLTYAWSSSPGAGVDAGASCTFANPSSLATTVQCNDDGTRTIHLAVSDGINPAVVTDATLTVANVAPSVTITSPAAGSSSRSVSFAANVTDPGSNDVLSCSIDWGDGTAATTAPVVSGQCTATHTYAASVATATITVTASDDDGGTATATRSLSFNRPPICSAVKAVPDVLWPPDGDLRLVTLVGAYDPDGGPVTYTITAVTQDEELGSQDGHDYDWYKKWHKKPPPDAVILHGPYLLLRAWRDPHGDGRTYTISFTVTDSQGATCSGTTTVEVPHDLGHHSKHGHKDYDSFGWR
jgi:PKD domain-containing protein